VKSYQKTKKKVHKDLNLVLRLLKQETAMFSNPGLSKILWCPGNHFFLAALWESTLQVVKHPFLYR